MLEIERVSFGQNFETLNFTLYNNIQKKHFACLFMYVWTGCGNMRRMTKSVFLYRANMN